MARDSPVLPSVKKLRRNMPHVFCRMLQLPFYADYPVDVRETQKRLIFSISPPASCFSLPSRREEDEIDGGVFVQVQELLPGVVKVCIGGREARKLEAMLNNLDILPWCFRLPPSCLPHQSTASYVDGILTVTIPKAPPVISTDQVQANNDDFDPRHNARGQPTVTMDNGGCSPRMQNSNSLNSPCTGVQQVNPASVERTVNGTECNTGNKIWCESPSLEWILVR